MVEKLVAVLIVGAVLAGAFRRPVLADQNYSCNPGMCCSIYGICGTGIYCRDSCLSGPCTSPPAGGGGPDCLSVADIVTEDIFDGIINQLDASCPGKNFYSRCAFLDAVNSHPNFGQGSYAEYSKREVAAFFAHAAHETRGFCYIEDVNGSSKDYCVENDTRYPCVPGKGYYGRGPLQITWNYNYGPAGDDIGFNGTNNPEIVANDPTISFKAALWLWMEKVHSVVNRGFSATIHAINGGECNGGNRDAVNDRVKYYQQYSNQLGVFPGDNLAC